MFQPSCRCGVHDGDGREMNLFVAASEWLPAGHMAARNTFFRLETAYNR
jgi:hypothetical protein